MAESKPHKPFDTATKGLLEYDPLAWLHFVGLPGTHVRMENTNMTTVTSDADRIMMVDEGDPNRYAANVEFQSGPDPGGDKRVFLYSAIGFCKLDVPIVSVVVLLRPEAEGPGFTGKLGFNAPGGGFMQFGYKLVRVWETPVEELLTGSLALLPLAPIADVTEAQLPEVVRRMERRLNNELEAGERGLLWTSTAATA